MKVPQEKPQVFDFRKRTGAGAGGPGGSGGGIGGGAGEGAPRPRLQLARPVLFVGFMGAGKTSVARKLARRAGVAAIDMDTYIVRRADRTVAQIFAERGEEGFRAMETSVLRELLQGDPALVSCGGGVVLKEENREILRTGGGFVVYLQVTADEAASRISNVESRPLFGDLENARRVIAGRLPLYEEVADATVDTAGRGSGAVAREVFGLLRRKGVLADAPGAAAGA